MVSRKISGGTRSKQGSNSKMALASLFGTWRARDSTPFWSAVNSSSPLNSEQSRLPSLQGSLRRKPTEARLVERVRTMSDNHAHKISP